MADAMQEQVDAHEEVVACGDSAHDQTPGGNCGLWGGAHTGRRERLSGRNGEPVRVPPSNKGKVCGGRSSRWELLWTDNKSYSSTLCPAEGGGIIGIRNGE